jgi:hypothetical protein
MVGLPSLPLPLPTDMNMDLGLGLGLGGGPGRPPRMMPTSARAGGGYAASRLAALGETPTNRAHDELDKGLEQVQSLCEHGAHQFLRDGDCGDEVGRIQRRLREVKALADREMARVAREEPEALRAPPPQSPPPRQQQRSYRPHGMRRDLLGLAGTAKPDDLEVDVRFFSLSLLSSFFLFWRLFGLSCC